MASWDYTNHYYYHIYECEYLNQITRRDAPKSLSGLSDSSSVSPPLLIIGWVEDCCKWLSTTLNPYTFF